MTIRIDSNTAVRRPAAARRLLPILMALSMFAPGAAPGAEAAASNLPASQESSLAVRGTARIPAAGADVLLTGEVVAGQRVTFTAVDKQGAVLSGAVVEVNGEEVRTDENGQATVLVPAGAAAFAVVMMTRSGPVRAAAKVRPAVSALPGAPAITRAPSNPTPGSLVTVSGEDFDGVAAGNTVMLGSTETAVVSASPVSLMTVVSADAEIGPQALTVETANGVSEPLQTEVTRIWFEADTKLRSGQAGTGYVYVSSKGVKDVVLTNHNDVVAFDNGASVLNLTTDGQEPNRAAFSYVANHPGTFNLRAEIADSVFDVGSSDTGPGPLAQAAPATPEEKVDAAEEKVEKAIRRSENGDAPLRKLINVLDDLEDIEFEDGQLRVPRGAAQVLQDAIDKLRKLLDDDRFSNDAKAEIWDAIQELEAAKAAVQETPLDAFEPALDGAHDASKTEAQRATEAAQRKLREAEEERREARREESEAREDLRAARKELTDSQRNRREVQKDVDNAREDLQEAQGKQQRARSERAKERAQERVTEAENELAQAEAALQQALSELTAAGEELRDSIEDLEHAEGEVKRAEEVAKEAERLLSDAKEAEAAAEPDEFEQFLRGLRDGYYDNPGEDELDRIVRGLERAKRENNFPERREQIDELLEAAQTAKAALQGE